MKTELRTMDEIIERRLEVPLDVAVIPNHMGINLCSVEAMSWTRRDDGQLVSLTIHFIPSDESGDARDRSRRGRRGRRQQL